MILGILRSLSITLPGLVSLGIAMAAGADPSPAPTWAADVAPILYAQCISCHHEGGSGPFSLVHATEAQRHAERIVRALTTGHMPPWLPSSAGPPMVGERRLTDAQIEKFVEWAAAGAPIDDSAQAARAPVTEDGWSLGPPDLVVNFPAYEAPAEGFDVYRNLVVSPELDQPVWVRAVDLQPGNARLVHHARFMVDKSASSRLRDAEEPGTGFDGMHMGTQAASPDGFFVGWTPGRVADPGRADLAWRLEPGTDLVLQVHLRPTGQREWVQPRIGFYLAEQPPEQQPVVIMLENKQLDIPAGDPNWVAEERFRTPVAVEALTIYPHAHYIGRRVRAWADLPSGERRELLTIDEWDFNWQDQYRYVEPQRIPANSEIVMQWSFDNTADNPRNPNSPPQRVTFGPQSTDEMAELNLQVLPVDPDDRPQLVAALRELYRAADASFMATTARERADRFAAAGDWPQAVEAYREALLEATDPDVMERMAAALIGQGDGASAVFVAEQAVALGAEPVRALLTLAHAYQLAGRSDAARSAAERGLQIVAAPQAAPLADSLRAFLRERY